MRKTRQCAHFQKPSLAQSNASITTAGRPRNASDLVLASRGLYELMRACNGCASTPAALLASARRPVWPDFLRPGRQCCLRVKERRSIRHGVLEKHTYCIGVVVVCASAVLLHAKSVNLVCAFAEVHDLVACDL